MYQIKDKVYADAGKILIGKNKIGYILTGNIEDFTEEDIYLDDMVIDGNLLRYSNGRIVERYIPNESYAQLKARIIKRKYSNDDQIAIMLNKDNSELDLMYYNKMQEWREWASILAHSILLL